MLAAAQPSLPLQCTLQNRLPFGFFTEKCSARPVEASYSNREQKSGKKAAATADGSDGDVVREHWLVRDMFSFENVGFTRDVGNVKFLVCADCEAGPIGWHCVDDKDSFYVALERVAHE
uniref:RAB interacting factor n=1 Tax=Meleagris gallopavo TaxID=9103 RepID=A0A803YKN6_MELGA